MRDELLYSLLSRYREQLCIRSSGYLIRDAYSVAGKCSATLPRNVERFASTIFAHRPTAEELLVEHTAFPYLSAFLSEPSRALLKAAFLADEVPRGWRVGFHGTGSNPFLKFCGDCITEDIQEEGQTAWRRVHQLPGVVVCPVHHARLRVSETKAFTRSLETCPLDPRCGTAPISVIPIQVEASFAAASLWLLANTLRFEDRRVLALTMQRLILTAGWCGHRYPQISADFARHVLRIVGLDMAVWGTQDAAKILKRLPTIWQAEAKLSAAPIAYLAVLAALDKTMEDLQGELDKTEAEATGRASDQLGKGVPRRARSPVGVTEFYKTRVRRALDGPDVSLTSLQRHEKGALRHLSKHDPEWLHDASPASTRLRDWASRDAQLATKIDEAAGRLLAKVGKPERVTRNALARQVRTVSFFDRHKASLPLTEAAIARHAENRQQAAVRRLRWVAFEFVRRRERVSIGRLRVLVWWPECVEGLAAALPALIARCFDQESSSSFFQNEFEKIALAQHK